MSYYILTVWVQGRSWYQRRRISLSYYLLFLLPPTNIKDEVLFEQLSRTIILMLQKCIFIVYAFLLPKVQLNVSWFVIHDEVLNFQGWILYHEPFHEKQKAKSIGIINRSVTFNMNVILTLQSVNFAELCAPFPWIDSLAFIKSNSDLPLLNMLHKNL